MAMTPRNECAMHLRKLMRSVESVGVHVAQRDGLLTAASQAKLLRLWSVPLQLRLDQPTSTFGPILELSESNTQLIRNFLQQNVDVSVAILTVKASFFDLKPI